MNYSIRAVCGYCNNVAPMEIIGSVADIKTQEYEDGPPDTFGDHYEVLRCPNCEKVNIARYFWHDGMESEDDISDYEILYPNNRTIPIGMPDEIRKSYEAAEKVKTIEVNAYAILMRRLLELVCIDKKANGATLALMLKDLADKKEIPEKLVSVAGGLRNFGNIGAHAGSGNLSENEIPIVKALTDAILEYLYSAPHLATLAENKLNAIKTKKP